MAKVIFTPWKHTSDLLAVRNYFYPPPEYEGPDLRERACATVSAWKIRGNLPHPVEATALLTDAILHDDARKNSVFSIRATYAAAFCRFVTGLVDSKLGARKSMFSRAVELGLPASFVELRHEATHRELPSLTVLRGAVGRSLEWLWSFYWAGVGSVSVSVPSGINGVQGGKEVVRDVIEQARALIEPGPKDTSGSGSGTEPPRKRRRVQQEVASVAARAISVSRGSKDATGLIAREMLAEGVLVPAGRRIGDSLTETITRWDPFLQQVSEGHPLLLVTLTETMAEELAFSPFSLSPSDPNDKKDEKNPHHEAVYIWLDHILHSAQWESQRRFISLSYIRAVCGERKNHWTGLLKKSLGKGDNGSPAPGLQKKSRIARSSDEGDSLQIDEDMKALSKFGWRMVDTWDTRPVGMV
ncbi:rRNA-processing protein LAS1 [Aspergillus undulatus]|uniref:rRNA-processing protein LAS1 n=1 Tax=Aspergillus undulatus TaxID=1810928 RepID=UPI003CCD8732